MTRYIDYGRMSIKKLEISDWVHKSLITEIRDRLHRLEMHLE